MPRRTSGRLPSHLPPSRLSPHTWPATEGRLPRARVLVQRHRQLTGNLTEPLGCYQRKVN